jgi:CopG antitoxin of type II toxin-antitoxin system
MKEPRKLKKLPVLKTDAEAEHFVETADLTEYDLSVMVAVSSASISNKRPES